MYLMHSHNPRRRRERKIARGKRGARCPWDARLAPQSALKVREPPLRSFRALRILGNLIQVQRDLRSLAPGYLLLAPPMLHRRCQVDNHRVIGVRPAICDSQSEITLVIGVRPAICDSQSAS